MGGPPLITAADSANMANVRGLAPTTRETRAKRATTLAATAASQVRATNGQFSSSANTPAHRQSSRLQTDLRASDSTKKLQDEVATGSTDIEHTDEEGLRFAGYRGSDFFSELDRDSSESSEMSICVCETVVEDVEVEALIRCSVRDCEVGWFHLSCVGLPDHPPRFLGWMCPDCIVAQGISTNVKGLFDVKQGESTVKARAWLTEIAKELKLHRERDKAEQAHGEKERERAEMRGGREKVMEKGVIVID